MKKIFTLAIALLTFAGNAMALDYEPEQGFTWQAFVGMNATKVTNLGYGGKIGGVFGLKLDYMLPKAHGTYLSAGVDWTMKGAKTDAKAVSASNTTYDGTDKFRLNYLEIPIRMGYRYNLSRELGVFGEFGPYFASTSLRQMPTDLMPAALNGAIMLSRKAQSTPISSVGMPVWASA